jgi:hypothetical protein
MDNGPVAAIGGAAGGRCGRNRVDNGCAQRYSRRFGYRSGESRRHGCRIGLCRWFFRANHDTARTGRSRDSAQAGRGAGGAATLGPTTQHVDAEHVDAAATPADTEQIRFRYRGTDQRWADKQRTTGDRASKYSSRRRPDHAPCSYRERHLETPQRHTQKPV